MAVLRASWDESKFKAGMAASRGDEEGKQIVSSDVTNIPGVDLFMAYLVFVLLIDEVLLQLTTWAESCSCHEDLLKDPDSSLRKQKGAKRRRFSVTSVSGCIMLGRRLSEICAGQLDELLQTLCRQCLVNLMMEKRHLLNPEQWATLHADFARAKALLDAEMRVTIHLVQRLPW